MFVKQEPRFKPKITNTEHPNLKIPTQEAPPLTLSGRQQGETPMADAFILPSSHPQSTSPPPPSPSPPQPPQSPPSQPTTPTIPLHEIFPRSFSILVQYQHEYVSHSNNPTHAFITLLPSLHPLTLANLGKRAIQALRDTANPNNEHPVPGTAVFDALIVHWGVSQQSRQAQIQSCGLAFPNTTVLAEENLAAVLGFMLARGGGGGGGYDFIEVRFHEGGGKAREGKKVTFGPEVKGEDGGQERRKWRTKGKGADRGFQAPDLLNYDL